MKKKTREKKPSGGESGNVEEEDKDAYCIIAIFITLSFYLYQMGMESECWCLPLLLWSLHMQNKKGKMKWANRAVQKGKRDGK